MKEASLCFGIMLFKTGPLSIHLLILSVSLSCARSLFLFCSGFIPPLLMDTPHVWLIKNQLKTPRRQVSRATPTEGRIEALPAHSLSLFLSSTHILSISSSRDLSSCLLLSQAPPSCLLEVGNMIYEKRGRNLYIFFPRASSHLFIRFLFLSLVERRIGLVESG